MTETSARSPEWIDLVNEIVGVEIDQIIFLVDRPGEFPELIST
jgi:hypothetical protein